MEQFEDVVTMPKASMLLSPNIHRDAARNRGIRKIEEGIYQSGRYTTKNIEHLCEPITVGDPVVEVVALHNP